MKIREKLLSLPLIVLVFMVILGMVAVFSMNQMGSSARDIYEIQFKKYQLSSAALDDARAANIGVYRLFTWLNNYDEKKIKSVAADIDKNIDDATKKANELMSGDNLTISERDNLRDVLNSLASYKKEVAQSIEMAEVDPNMGLSSMQTADKTFLKLQGQIEALVQIANKSANEQYLKSSRTSKTALAGFVVILIVAIVSSIAISLWLGGRIIRSLNQTILIAKRIAKGDLTGSVVVEGSDEIAELEMALREMQSNLHEIVSGILAAADAVQTMSQSLNGSSSTIVYGISEQHKAATTMASAVEEMSMNINVINTHAQSADEAMKNSNQLALDGKKCWRVLKNPCVALKSRPLRHVTWWNHWEKNPSKFPTSSAL